LKSGPVSKNHFVIIEFAPLSWLQNTNNGRAVQSSRKLV
jgi:hypothetical protein